MGTCSSVDRGTPGVPLSRERHADNSDGSEKRLLRKRRVSAWLRAGGIVKKPRCQAHVLSRGALMLRAARSGIELAYASVGAISRHGPRPIRIGYSMEPKVLV